MARPDVDGVVSSKRSKEVFSVAQWTVTDSLSWSVDSAVPYQVDDSHVIVPGNALREIGRAVSFRKTQSWTGGRLGGERAGLGERSELGEQPQHITQNPRFYDLAVLDAVDITDVDLSFDIRGGYSHQLAVVGTGACVFS